MFNIYILYSAFICNYVCETHPDAANEAGWTSMLQKLQKLLGKPHTHDVLDKEKAAAQQMEADEKFAQEEALQKERELKEAEQKKKLEEEKLEWVRQH